MRADFIDVAILDTPLVYRAEGIRRKGGVQATVTVYRDGERGHSDRLNLDKARERERFAEAAGTDPDDLVLVRETVLELLEGAPAGAAPAEAIDPETEARALALLDAPDLLAQAAQAIADLGYVAPKGCEHLPKIVFLAFVSRLLVRPLNLVVAGPSAAGKSFLVMIVARLSPPDAIYVLSGMSERVLAYTDADLRHRMLVIGEASALHREGIGASLLRNIAWEGHLVYETVEKTTNGLKPRRIEKPGPTGFVTTTTSAVEKELNTRVLELTVPDTPAATRVILRATAERANGHAPAEPDLRVWHALQRWLERDGVREVSIPYAAHLAELVPAGQVRMRRDFTQLLTMLQAHAVLHQRQRERDEAGRIVADARDYTAVYGLVAPIFQALAAEGVTPQLRETVQAVRDLTPEPGDTVGMARLSAHLKLDRTTVQRRVNRALALGYLVNEETRTRQPHKLRAGDPLPDDAPALPAPEEIITYLARTSAQVHKDTENPHGDAETAGTDALVHLCTGDSDTENDGAADDLLARVQVWLDFGELDDLGPIDLGPGERVVDPAHFARTYLVDAGLPGRTGERARARLARFAAVVAPRLDGVTA